MGWDSAVSVFFFSSSILSLLCHRCCCNRNDIQCFECFIILLKVAENISEVILGEWFVQWNGAATHEVMKWFFLRNRRGWSLLLPNPSEIKVSDCVEFHIQLANVAMKTLIIIWLANQSVHINQAGFKCFYHQWTEKWTHWNAK